MARLVIEPGQEESWLLGNTGITSDGTINVWRFFNDLDAGWELGHGERWRLSYRIAWGGVPDMKFSVVMSVEDGKPAVHLED